MLLLKTVLLLLKTLLLLIYWEHCWVLGFVGVALGTVVIVDILGVIVGIGCRFVVDIGSTCCCYWEHLLLLLVILGVVGIGKVVVGDIGSRLREKLRCR